MHYNLTLYINLLTGKLVFHQQRFPTSRGTMLFIINIIRIIVLLLPYFSHSSQIVYEPSNLVHVVWGTTGISEAALSKFLQVYSNVCSSSLKVAMANRMSKRDFAASTRNILDSALEFLKAKGIHHDSTRNFYATVLLEDLYFYHYELTTKLDFEKLGEVKELSCPDNELMSSKFIGITVEVKRLIGCLKAMEQKGCTDFKHCSYRLLQLLTSINSFTDDKCQAIYLSIIEKYLVEFVGSVIRNASSLKPFYDQAMQVSVKRDMVPQRAEDSLWICIQCCWNGSKAKKDLTLDQAFDLLKEGQQLGVQTYAYLFLNFPWLLEDQRHDCDRIILWCRKYESFIDQLIAKNWLSKHILPSYNYKLSALLERFNNTTMESTFDVILQPSPSEMFKCNSNVFGFPVVLTCVLSQEIVLLSKLDETDYKQLKIELGNLKLSAKYFQAVSYPKCVNTNNMIEGIRGLSKSLILESFKTVEGLVTKRPCKLGQLYKKWRRCFKAMVDADCLMIIPQFDSSALLADSSTNITR